METNQTELVEFLKQDEEEMQNWMKEMGKNMDELKTKIDELPGECDILTMANFKSQLRDLAAKVVEELQRASKNPPMFKLEIGGIYIQAGTSLPPTTAQPVTYSSPPPTSSMPGIVSEPKPVLYYKSRKGSGIPAKIGGLFKFKLRSIRAHSRSISKEFRCPVQMKTMSCGITISITSMIPLSTMQIESHNRGLTRRLLSSGETLDWPRRYDGHLFTGTMRDLLIIFHRRNCVSRTLRSKGGIQNHYSVYSVEDGRLKDYKRTTFDRGIQAMRVTTRIDFTHDI